MSAATRIEVASRLDLAGVAAVAELAYRIVLVAFHDLSRPPAPPDPTFELPAPMTGRVVDHFVARIGADEADVLRAMAELERVGALEPMGAER